jgi:hypothetical protein
MEGVSHAGELGNSNSEDEPFDWGNNPSVILHDQAAVAAYFNPYNELVLRQRDTLGCETIAMSSWPSPP